MTTAARPHRRAGKAAPEPARHARIRLTVNGEPRDVVFDGSKTLLEVLREDLGLGGTKHGCELGECGACAVLMDGHPVLSCLVLGVACDGKDVVTIEGVADGPELHPLQATMADLGGAQCGYCTPGIVLTAKHLLDHHPKPTRAQIAEALSGNLCRCTGYRQIFEAVEAAAERLRGGPGPQARGSVGARQRAGDRTAEGSGA
jgi:aerobic-type carbon monoxide dehydrogenase small subunit (CoxS/CutS family)